MVGIQKQHANGGLPDPREAIRLAAHERPILMVVIDTEEEFDWDAPFDRGATSVRAMQDIGRFQEVFEEFQVCPTYVADYPVVTQEAGIAPLREFQSSGRALVGAHLHPWVSPPHEEEVCARNSYPGNLPEALEREKLSELVSAIETNLGERPRVYKAGRYGFGAHTAAILEELDFEVDLSPCPPFDFRPDGGPCYSGMSAEPYWFGSRGQLLGVPTTGAYVGFIQSGARNLYHLATRPALRWARLPGVLARLKAIDRLHLSPEGYSTRDHKRLTCALLAQGVRTFTLSFHSPSATPGCTPYVRTEKDLLEFLDSCRYYFEFFLGELNGVSMTPLELKAHLSVQSAERAVRA